MKFQGSTPKHTSMGTALPLASTCLLTLGSNRKYKYAAKEKAVSGTSTSMVTVPDQCFALLCKTNEL
eukprot:2372974-Amphidinium_carterae.1